MLAILIMLKVNGSVSLYACLFVLIVSAFIVTPFISLHLDAATGILMTLLVE
jgi:hypothetical protein